MIVVLIDDDELFCSSLANVFSVMDKSVRITTHKGVADAKHAETQPDSVDLVLLDYHLPDSKFLQNIKIVRDYFVQAKIAIVSGEDDARLIIEAIHYGAFGFIPKAASSAVLMAAIKLIYQGQVYLPETVLSLSKGQSIETKIANLSAIKKSVLKQLITGKANKVIEYDLGIATSTLNGHLSEIFKLLGVKTRTEAVIAVASLEF